jgi:hypothetical protein
MPPSPTESATPVLVVVDRDQRAVRDDDPHIGM